MVMHPLTKHRAAAVLATAATAAIAGAGCLGAATGPGEAPAPRQALTLVVSRADHLAGSFQRQGVQLRFDSRRQDGLTITGLRRGDGSELVLWHQGASHGRMSVLGRLEIDRQGDDASAVSQAGDSQAMVALFAAPEIGLLPALIEALAGIGIQAAGSPAVEPLARFADVTKQMLGRPPAGEAPKLAKRTHCPIEVCPVDEVWDEDRCACVSGPEPGDTTGPAQPCVAQYPGDLRCDPNNNNCRGMCGFGCNCDTICGDCRRHEGCYNHDVACDACVASWGLNAPACFVCTTPLYVIIAKAGC
jgi:hypothetical protein